MMSEVPPGVVSTDTRLGWAESRASASGDDSVLMHWWDISCEEVGVPMYIKVSGTHQIQLNPPEA